AAARPAFGLAAPTPKLTLMSVCADNGVDKASHAASAPNFPKKRSRPRPPKSRAPALACSKEPRERRTSLRSWSPCLWHRPFIDQVEDGECERGSESSFLRQALALLVLMKLAVRGTRAPW